MDIFATLFGISSLSIKNTCVLTPFLTKEILDGFRIDKLSRGILYSVGDNGEFNLVYAGMGSTFLGDAVLYLKDTPCKNLILFGSCGAVGRRKPLGIGDIVLVNKAISQDSFVDMLFNKRAKDSFYPDKRLYNSLKNNLQEVNCLTVGSLKLEEEYLEHLNDNTIDIVDMETGAFYAAAKSSKIKAAAILFVTDILGKFPYYIALKKENRPALKKLTRKASKLVYELIEGM